MGKLLFMLAEELSQCLDKLSLCILLEVELHEDLRGAFGFCSCSFGSAQSCPCEGINLFSHGDV